jgi:nicotinate-nucleotide adenylyltransferase
MKIGIFAGTFDPVHSGHVAFAVKAVQETELDKVIIVAEKNPYRKKPFASWDHRQAMIERATKDIPEADHDYEFSNQLAHQYTMQSMLAAAKKHYGNEHEFWFLVGSDVFEHMSRWHDVALQREYGGFVVMLRDDHTRAWLDHKRSELMEAHMPIRVTVIANDKPHISSRKIRDNLKESAAQGLIDPQVAQYIAQHSLYESA